MEDKNHFTNFLKDYEKLLYNNEKTNNNMIEDFVIKHNEVIKEIYKINQNKKNNNVVSTKIIINKKKIFELFFKKLKFNLLKFEFISKNEFYETILLIKNFGRFFFVKNKEKKNR